MAKRLLIEGRVQGVGYRASFADQAVAMGLKGWVRNRRDGTVEACIDGDAATLDAIIQWAKRGPPSAQVTHVAVEDAAEPVDAGFRILQTY